MQKTRRISGAEPRLTAALAGLEVLKVLVACGSRHAHKHALQFTVQAAPGCLQQHTRAGASTMAPTMNTIDPADAVADLLANLAREIHALDNCSPQNSPYWAECRLVYSTRTTIKHDLVCWVLNTVLPRGSEMNLVSLQLLWMPLWIKDKKRQRRVQ